MFFVNNNKNLSSDRVDRKKSSLLCGTNKIKRFNMKYLSFFALTIALLFTSCKPDPATDNGQTQTQSSTQTSTQPNPADAADQNNGHVAEAVLPDMSSNTVNLLLSTFWVAERWVNHADNTQNKPNMGRWWRFNADGTFVTGKWEETLSHGSWVIYFDQEKELLHLDAANDALNMEFEIQQIVRSGEYMSWVGTTTYKMNRIAVKAISLLSIPTKDQFGFVD